MTEPPTHRRSPLVSLLIFLGGLTIGLLLLALSQLDIGTYKQQLAAQLEKALHKPVTLGDVELSFHGGIALDFRNLRIGDDNKFSLHVPQLTTILRPLSLLQGEITIEQVRLESPSLKLELPLELTNSGLNLEHLDLKTLQVRNGSLFLSRPGPRPQQLRIENFNLVIHGLGKGLVSQFATTATLLQQEQNTDLKAFIELTRLHPGQPWRQSRLRGNISLDNLHRTLLPPVNIPGLPRQFNLSVGVEGVPVKQVLLESELKDSRNDSRLVNLAASWQSTPLRDNFTNLKIGVVGIPLAGKLALQHDGTELTLNGGLHLENIPLHQVLSKTDPTLTKLSGQIERLDLSIDGPLHATADNPFAPLRSADLTLTNLAYPLGEAAIRNTSLALELRNARLSLHDGHGELAGTPISFSGSSGPLDQARPDFSFTLHGVADLQQLQQEVPTLNLKHGKFSGKAPFDLRLKGPAENLNSELAVDLSDTELIDGHLLQKESGVPLKVKLETLIEPRHLTLRTASMTLGDSTLRVKGEFARQKTRWTGTLEFAPLQLKKLQEVSPLLSHFSIAGEVEGQVNLDETGNWSARIALQNGATHLTHVLSDLNHVSANVRIDRNGLDLGTVKARLGDSPIRVEGELRGWHGALLALHVTGKELYARDLIFTNRSMKLQNLDGTLLIGTGGITFDPVLVTVENRTTARVEGQMRGYYNPHTYLEVSSEDADILDIIHLFSGPHSAPPPGSQHRATLELAARAAKGQLGSLFFENAQGTIHDRDGVFTIDPLTFNLGAGQAAGRVEIEQQRNNLLKISGRAQNCDADRVYKMLFEKSGIFRGTLNADFYLEGEESGEQFWKTANGGGHLQIHKGAMRELKGFARIFSLLNVSQLFKFRLPDMDKEGLPFSLLETSARMTDGVLHYDDFKITSPAINISSVGKINTLKKTIDSTVGIKPLRTVDIILSRVPLFGWVLTGKEEALITALFTLKGPLENPKVEAAPASSIARTALGIITRALGLPFRLIEKTNELLTAPPRPTEKNTPQQTPEGTR